MQLTVDSYLCNQCCQVPRWNKNRTFFEYVDRKSRPPSETVGNGLCAVPGTLQIQLRADKWYYASRGGAPRSELKNQ